MPYARGIQKIPSLLLHPLCQMSNSKLLNIPKVFWWYPELMDKLVPPNDYLCSTLTWKWLNNTLSVSSKLSFIVLKIPILTLIFSPGRCTRNIRASGRGSKPHRFRPHGHQGHGPIHWNPLSASSNHEILESEESFQWTNWSPAILSSFYIGRTKDQRWRYTSRPWYDWGKSFV